MRNLDKDSPRLNDVIRLRTMAIALAIVVLAGCGSAPGPRRAISAATGPAAGPVPGWRLSAGQFVSERYGPDGTQFITLSDTATGALVRRLLPATTSDGMQVTGLALDRAGDLWITYSKGPDYQSNVAGGDPRPGSCANQVDVVHAGTGRVTVALRTGNNVLIWGAQPSPDGRELVYRESGCTAYETSYLQVKSISSEQHWSIGQGLPDCHLLTGGVWSSNGKTLLVDYGPPTTPYSYDPSPGACTQWWAGRLVLVNAGQSQSWLAGTTTVADPGCQIDAVGGMKGGGALAIEGCGGGPDFNGGPVRLLVIAADGRIARRMTLGACADGTEIAMNQDGTAALIDAYFSCGPAAQVTRLWEYRDGMLRPISSAPGNGGALGLMAWRG
jgi:hypothetical protein